MASYRAVRRAPEARVCAIQSNLFPNVRLKARDASRHMLAARLHAVAILNRPIAIVEVAKRTHRRHVWLATRPRSDVKALARMHELMAPAVAPVPASKAA